MLSGSFGCSSTVVVDSFSILSRILGGKIGCSGVGSVSIGSEGCSGFFGSRMLGGKLGIEGSTGASSITSITSDSTGSVVGRSLMLGGIFGCSDGAGSLTSLSIG